MIKYIRNTNLEHDDEITLRIKKNNSGEAEVNDPEYKANKLLSINKEYFKSVQVDEDDGQGYIDPINKGGKYKGNGKTTYTKIKNPPLST